MLTVINLGGHISEGPHDDPRFGMRGFEDPGDAKVDHLDRPHFIEHYISRLNVPVYDPSLVCVVECPASLDGIFKLQGQRDRQATRNDLAKALAIYKFHGNKRDDSLIAHFINGCNIRVLKYSQGLSLTIKSLKQIRIIR